MFNYEETELLQEFAKVYREFEITRDLSEFEDLELYIYSIKSRFFDKEQFPEHFARGYELIRKDAELRAGQTNKYSREKYFQEE